MNPPAAATTSTLESVCQHIAAEAFRRWNHNEDYVREFGVLPKALSALWTANLPYPLPPDPPLRLGLIQNASGNYGRSGVEQLGQIGAAFSHVPDEIVAALIQRWQDMKEYREVRDAAVKTLKELGPAAATPGFITFLTACLSDNSKAHSSFDETAVAILGGLGSAAATPEVVEALLRHVTRRVTHTDGYSRYYRIAAAAALNNIGVALPQDAIEDIADTVIALLRDGELFEQEDATAGFEALRRQGTPRVLKALIACLEIQVGEQDSLPNDIRATAAEILGRLATVVATEEDAANVRAALIRALADTEDTDDDRKFRSDDWGNVREAAAKALRTMTADGTEVAGLDAAVDSMIRRLRDGIALVEEEYEDDPPSVIRREDAWVLGILGGLAATPPVLETLVAFLRNSPDGLECQAVAAALSHMCVTPMPPATRDTVLETFAEYLGNPKRDAEVRETAARAVGAMGALAATPAVLDALIVCLNDDHYWHSRRAIREAAFAAVRDMGAAAATIEMRETLLRCLRDNEGQYWHEDTDVSWVVQASAASALGGLGLAAATPDLIEVMLRGFRKENSRVGAEISKALKKISHHSQFRFFLHEGDSAYRSVQDLVRGDLPFLSETASQAAPTLTWSQLCAICLGAAGNTSKGDAFRAALLPLLHQRLIALRAEDVRYALVTGPLIDDVSNPTGFEAQPLQASVRCKPEGVVVDLETLVEVTQA